MSPFLILEFDIDLIKNKQLIKKEKTFCMWLSLLVDLTVSHWFILLFINLWRLKS